MSKRILSFFLAAVMVFSVMPLHIFAENGETGDSGSEGDTFAEISFSCDPGNTVVSVYQNASLIPADEDGSYRLAPGEYTWKAECEGFVPQEEDFTVSDEDQKIEITLAEEGTEPEWTAQQLLDQYQALLDACQALLDAQEQDEEAIAAAEDAIDAFLDSLTEEQLAAMQELAGVSAQNQAENTAPGTRQILTSESIGGDTQVYHAVENGHQLTLYCFNSNLHWPITSPTFSSDYYVPDNMLYLSEEVKDKVYRIFYAGYPHNNLGLYAASENPVLPSLAELEDACDPPQALKAKYPETDWSSLSFTPDKYLSVSSSTNEYKILYEFSQTIWSDEELKAAASAKPNFVYVMWAYMMGPSTVGELLNTYSAFLPKVNAAGAHDATQYAVWRILHENGVENNSKDMVTQMNTIPLVKALVDFANGVGEYAGAKIPARGTTISEMEVYKNTFETGSLLLRADGTAVGKDSPIVFTKNDSGMYVSETLHFSNEAYALPYTVALKGNGSVISSVINYGTGEIVLFAESEPENPSVTVSTENKYPSDVYQYVREQQAGMQASALSFAAGHIQDMSGCYYESVPISLSLSAVFREAPLKPVTVSFSGSKTFEDFPENSTIVPEFSFTLSENGVVLETKTVQKQGTFAFSDITYTEEGTHTYVVSETAGNQAGVTYSTAAYTIAVEVKADDHRQLVAAIKVNGTDVTGNSVSSLNFTNSYQAEPVDVVFSGVKMLVGRDLAAEEFRFTLSGNGLSHTVRNGADGKFTFPKLTFSVPGAYTYTVQEETDSIPGVTFDTRVYEITVTVSDSGSGKLTAVLSGGTSTGGDLYFVNTFKSGSLSISKAVTGDQADANAYFTFTVTFDVEGSFPYTGSKSGTISSGESIQLKHGESITITGLPAGTNYTVTETDNTGYRVYKSGDTGVIASGQTAKASFTNVKSSVPMTGDERDLILWSVMLAVCLLGAVATLPFMRKRGQYQR